LFVCGTAPHAKIAAGPGIKLRLRAGFRHEAEILTGAVGMINISRSSGSNSLGLDKRTRFLSHVNFCAIPWPLRASDELGQSITWPVQYLRAAHETADARVPVNLEKYDLVSKNSTQFPKDKQAIRRRESFRKKLTLRECRSSNA